MRGVLLAVHGSREEAAACLLRSLTAELRARLKDAPVESAVLGRLSEGAEALAVQGADEICVLPCLLFPGAHFRDIPKELEGIRAARPELCFRLGEPLGGDSHLAGLLAERAQRLFLKEGEPIRPSVCVEMIGRGLPMRERLHLARECGCGAVEFWSWWDKDLDEIARAREEYSLQIAAFCTRMENPGDPSRRDAWLSGLEESAAVARRLGCPTLIAQPGAALAGVSGERQRTELAETLQKAAELLKGTGVVLALEPLNPIDHPGCFLVHSAGAFALLEEVGRPEVKLLFDVYHQQVSEGNLAANLLPHIGQVVHLHLAGVPGRHEPTEGEINAGWLLSRLREAGYRGFVGLEYEPLGDAGESLRRVRSLFD